MASSSSYLITDASSPLGLAIVEELLLQTPPTTTVIALVDKDAEGSRHLQALRERVYTQIEKAKSRLCIVDLDVAGSGSGSRMIERIGEAVERVERMLQEGGGNGLDCLILNAGLGEGEADGGGYYDWKNEGFEDLTPTSLDTHPATDTTTILHAFLPLLRRGRGHGRDKKILTLTTTPARGSGTGINTLIRTLSGNLKNEGIAAFLVHVGSWQGHTLHSSHSTTEEEKVKEKVPLEPPRLSSPSRVVRGLDKHPEHGGGDGDGDGEEEECECEPDFICPRPCPWAKRRGAVQVPVPRNERELARGCLRVLGRCGVEMAGEVLGWDGGRVV
ncbi:hypothetical protein FQN50_008007 [Emmonsiellopsis sp. PD_5]|nr:hypothetical protein FQN50_008007 [Emmonsiellopsis sp. PD_5]